jgi:hypothetical protein
MSAVKLSNCKNLQEYTSKIQGYVNDFNLCAESSTGTMPKSEHSYHLMQGIPKDNDWRVFTQLMYDKINTLDDTVGKIFTRMKAHELLLQMYEYLEVATMFSKLQMKSNRRKPSRKSRTTRDSGSESDGSCPESEMHRHRHTQECYRCHRVGHTARYCPSTAPLESGAPTETVAAVTTMMTTSIQRYWITVTGRSPQKEGWYLDCAAHCHICGDWQQFEWYTENTTRYGQEIRGFAGMVAGKAIGQEMYS